MAKVEKEINSSILADKFPKGVMTFKWRDWRPLMFPNDFGTAFFRLPKYVVSFNHSNVTHSVNYGDGEGPPDEFRLKLTALHLHPPSQRIIARRGWR